MDFSKASPDVDTVYTLSSYPDIEKLHHTNVRVCQVRACVGLGFAMLFGTFAITTQGFELASAGFILSIAIIGICLAAISAEYKQQKVNLYKEPKQTHQKNVHILKSIGFLFAALGSGLLAAKLFTTLFCKTGLPNWAGPVPHGFFIGAMLILTIATCIQNQTLKEKIKAAGPFILQIIGASLLMVGAFQADGISNILPSNGLALHNLRIWITSFATIASISALATIFINSKLVAQNNSPTLEVIPDVPSIEESKHSTIRPSAPELRV